MKINFILSTAIIILFTIRSTTAQTFDVSYSDDATENFSGKVYLYLSKTERSPKSSMLGIGTFPCVSIAVKNIKPNQKVVFDDKAVSFPVSISDMERGDYYVQAVWDKNMGSRSIGDGIGNLYNTAVKVKFTQNRNVSFSLICNKVIEAPLFNDTKWTKLIKLKSPLLSSFHNKSIFLKAVVNLPEEYYTQPSRKFPVLYVVQGFGGDCERLSGYNKPSSKLDTTPVIRVVLDGACSLGHSVYANSDNNGPWGDALVNEIIPAIEKEFRCNAARLLNGHSSGGWTVLWLQTHYPKTFVACWSSSPDPVDFRNFLKVNLYEDKNMFYSKDSSLQPAATLAGYFPVMSMKDTYGMERVIDRGEQMHSLDAVFSQKNTDGNPRKVCDPITGDIDTVTVNHWKNYDLTRYLINNWDKLKNDLEGKIRVTIGNSDNFLLNHAVHSMDSEMKKINATIAFDYFPGDHFTVNSLEYRKAGDTFLEKKYNEFISR